MNLTIIKKWFLGVRVYIACAIGLVTLQSWWWAQVTYSGSNLITIRLQEVYAWLALILLVGALLIGPLLKLFPGLPGKIVLRDARRIIGIGAAWFALLHATISYVVLFGLPNPLTLAQAYKQSLALGIAGLIILLLMALTSFDGAMRRLGPWWFRLHRLVYVAGLVSLAHAFMVGTHAAALGAVIIIGIVTLVLLVMHIWVVLKAGNPTNLQVVTITLLIVFAAAVINYGVTQYLGYNLFLAGHKGYEG